MARPLLFRPAMGMLRLVGKVAKPRWETAEGLREEAMSDDWEEEDRMGSRSLEGSEHPRRSRRRKKRRSRGARDSSQLTPEERTYREAVRRADKKIALIRHSVTYFAVIFVLMLVSPKLGFIVALCWGIGLFSHFFQSAVAPDLRRRWISSEVNREVERTVTRQRRTLKGEQTRSLEELSASIAHEIRNPITAAKSLVQQMGEDPASSENVEYAQVALEELDRVERSISHLLRYAREEEMSVRSIQLSEVVDAAIANLHDRIQKAGVEIHRENDFEGEMDGDGEQLRRVFINLLGNALDVFEESAIPEPRIDVSLGENLAGTEIWARVLDNGPGLDEEARDRVFRPFFTSKASGTGLGLAISRKVVEAHGGTIEIESSQGAGTAFVLSFPRQASIRGTQT